MPRARRAPLEPLLGEGGSRMICCGEIVTDYTRGMAKQGPKAREKDERFWSHVDRNGPLPAHRPELGPCWMWTAFRKPGGYGFFSVRRGHHEHAHRVAWELTYGPPALHVLHRCDNRGCVNPAHLFEGTNADNVRDAVEKGRNTRMLGRANGRAKLTTTDVAAIRLSSQSLRALATRYGVSTTAIAKVRRGQAWRHVR